MRDEEEEVLIQGQIINANAYFNQSDKLNAILKKKNTKVKDLNHPADMASLDYCLYRYEYFRSKNENLTLEMIL